jgi:hypothetical protein
MAVRKVSQTQKQPNQPKAPEIPGDYYLACEQLDAIRHLVFAAQGIRHEFEEQGELLGVAELFQEFSGGLPSIMEKIEGQRMGLNHCLGMTSRCLDHLFCEVNERASKGGGEV